MPTLEALALLTHSLSHAPQAMPLLELTLDEVGARAPRVDAAAAADPEQVRASPPPIPTHPLFPSSPHAGGF
jgi:hypothetical protein